MSMFSKKPEEPVLRVAEACERLGVPPRVVLAYAIEGRLEARDGGVTEASVDRFLLSRERRIALTREVR